MTYGRAVGRKLFLDDERKPFDSSWDVVRSYDAFVDYVITHGVPDIISFDHDLAAEHYPISEESPQYENYKEKTGYHCALWMAEQGLLEELPAAFVHSMNYDGRRNIACLLREHRVNTDFIVWRTGLPPARVPVSFGGL